jgi:hypothetical protein
MLMFMKISCHGNLEFKGRALSGVKIGESENVMKAGVFSGKDRQRQMDGVGDICYSSYV